MQETSRVNSNMRYQISGLAMVFSLAPGLAAAEQVCVRDTLRAETAALRLEVSDDVVKDPVTSLMWRRCSEGVTGTNCDSGEPSLMSWPTALLHIEKINQSGNGQVFTDWRLPNIKEIVSIADLQCSNPSLNPEAFPSAPAMRIWSSTPYEFYPHFSWYVDTKDLLVDHVERSARYGVLLVRNYQ